jgi:hypothetical protein
MINNHFSRFQLPGNLLKTKKCAFYFRGNTQFPIYLGIRIFEKLGVKSSFHCLLKNRRHLEFFPKILTDSCSQRAQKSLRIDHLMLQKQRGTTKQFFPT